MSSIKLTADSGGGTFEIKAPSSSGNTRVLTLPDTGNATILTTDTSVGKILQVVSTNKTDAFSTSSSSFVDATGMSVSITPSAATSKIFIVISCHLGGAGSSYFGLNLLRGSTVVTQGTHGSGSMTNSSFGDYIESSNIQTQASFNFLDSPNTTSATTYKLQMASVYNGYTIYLNRTHNNVNASYTVNATSTITAMEVAA